MIQYYNRQTHDYEIEKIAGERYLNWTYSSVQGMKLLELLVKKKLFSSMYGSFCNSTFSKSKILKFIDKFDINIDDLESKTEDFRCFNDFFSRKLKTSSRPITRDNDVLISPGDGRLLAYEKITPNKLVQIKGITYRLSELLSTDDMCSRYEGGTCVILRLCPTDYHRFHFIDDGICENSIKIKGDYYSVNPVALKEVPQLFCRNKREWCLFHSKNFGDVIYVEVGATCVGSIIQTYKPNTSIIKGEEKGYFKFGGSTLILFFEKDKIKLDKDILEQSKLSCEVKVFMGEPIGRR